MSKYLKRYNETTRKWELISAPDVSVVQKLEDGSDITDTNVIITNVNYAGGESGETTLNETLTEISDDISRLQRNVSWLAEFGGGGGTGGGGDQKSFGIEIISPVLTDNAAYVSEKTFEVEFMITGGTDGDECQYAYTYDGIQTDYAIIRVNQSIKIPIDNTGSSKKQHDMAIRAINPYGSNIPAKSFTIYESTLTLAFDTATAGDDYKNGVYNIRQNSTYAYIPLILTNGLMNSTTVLTAKYSDVEPKSIQFINGTTNPQKLQMSLWDIAPKTSFDPDQYYILKFSASATLGVNVVNSNEVELRIRIVNPSEISITMGVNGKSGELVETPLNSSVVYNFKVYTPTFVPPVESTYYSAKITDGTNSYLILGQYYDEETCIPGKGYQDNDSISVGSTVSSQYVLSSSDFQSGQTVELCIRVWSMAGDRTASASTEILITAESNEIFPRQSNLRGGQGSTGNTIFLSWNKNNAASIPPTTWTSKITDYAFIDGYLAETQGNTVIANINILNANSESKITIDPTWGTPYLRLQNMAYAKANLTQYENEVKMITAEHSENYGFTVSFTFMADAVNDTKHTLLLWGENGADGALVNGIRIDSDKAYWVVKERTSGQSLVTKTISCPITSNVRTTVDFSYVKTPSGATIRIYLNGIVNAARDLNIISPLLEYTFPNEIYFGANYAQNAVSRFADLNIYEFSVYTKSLNDLQLIVNGKNARYTTLDNYTSWKSKNFITAKQTDEKIPESVFFDNGDYKAEFSGPQVADIAVKSDTPTLYLRFDQDAGFDSGYFYDKHTTQDTGATFPGKASYYDPSTNRWADNISILASLQGTSTLGYRIKNLELYIDETFEREGRTYTKLFQPKKEWFPESQFTLKADVVDSAHANNAVLGEWINNCGLFEDNPAMEQFGNNRPIDVNDQGQTRPDWGVDNDVTIKHTLEGFPILLFIKFSDKDLYTFLGIYSFNLGRYSYYNMGMKFLKSFSRREGDTKVACPKIINYYEEMENLGTVSGNNIYSFEMGNAGNENISGYPVWSQFTKSVVESYGDFKYPSSVSDATWGNLCKAFQSIAEFKITYYHGDSYNKYDDIRKYEIIDGQYVDVGEIYQDNQSIREIDSRIGGHLHIHNAMAYFVIANAFGMTDSLGKNLTLRTWDGGNTWYCCFYDMDTALGLANDGSESNPITVSIDKVTMISDPETSTSTLVTTYHDENSKYAAFSSKIWGVFRDDRFFYLTHSDAHYTYEYLWGELRRTGGKLSKSTNFSDIMATRVDSCGEMIYDYDYNTKYIQDTAEQEGGAAAAINFLHGTRVEYVRDWLRKHFYFLDGIFDVNRLGDAVQFTFEDSPYNSDILTISANYSSSIAVLPYTIQVSTPAFIGMTIGNDAFKKFYIDTENVDTVIYLHNGTSANSQISIKGSTLITKINGLQNGFLAIGSNEPGVARALSIFDVSGSRALNENPINIDSAGGIFGKTGSLEAINLSNTQGITPLQSYDVFLEPFNKLINVDVSNSEITSLSLPSTSLQSLLFHHSNIANFTLKNQNIINELNFEGCNKLQTITIEKCDAITSLTISNKSLLTSISIQNCRNLKDIVIEQNSALKSIVIGNNANLKSIKIANCMEQSLNIAIYGSRLENLILNELATSNVINLPSVEQMSAVSALNIDNCYYFGGFKYGNAEIEMYGEGEDRGFVFDLSPFESLNGENFFARNVLTLNYIRVNNDISNPFRLTSESLYGSGRILKRIFGHIEIAESGLFSGFSKLRIREPLEKVSGVTPVDDSYYQWEDGPYSTNVTINTASLKNCFSSTNCSISDVYYIFKQSRDINALTHVISVENAFDGCKNAKIAFNEDQLYPSIFDGISELSNINGVFNRTNIGGIISENILTPINDNLESFEYVFGNNEGKEDEYLYYISSDLRSFFKAGNKIKTIAGFNPRGETGGSEPYYLSDLMLTNLTELEFISDSFNNASISFTEEDEGGGFESCELFKTTVKLKSITDSFLNVTGWGSLKNIFGGESDSSEYYPSGLTEVVNSFSFADGSEHGGIDCPVINCDTSGVLMPIGNSFFKKIKSSIKFVGGSGGGSHFEKCFYSVFDTETGTKANGIKKYIDIDDCDGEDFCYKIFNGCENLEEIPYFFEDLDFSVTGLSQNLPISLLFDSNGRSIFSGLSKLRNVNGLFSNMIGRLSPTNIVTYVLSSGCAFDGCSVETAREIFAEGTGNNAAKRTGMIPYKLFYQGKENAEFNVIGTGISKNTAERIGVLSEFNDYVSSGGDPANFVFVTDTEMPDDIISGFTIQYEKPKKMIKNLSNVFDGSNFSGLTQFSFVPTDDNFDELYEINEGYNPIMFNAAQDESGNVIYSYNKEYDPYMYVWSRRTFDGNFSDYVMEITGKTSYAGLMSETDDYGNPVIIEIEDTAEYFNVTDNNGDGISEWDTGVAEIGTARIYDELFKKLNYICPQDLFSYCVNQPSTIIDSTFNNGSPEISVSQDGWSCGIKGRIPPYLFNDVNAINSISGTFNNCKGVLPHKWAKYINGAYSEPGELYPSTLLSGLTNLYSFANIFAQTSIWGRTIVPTDMFATNTELINVSSMWNSANWIEKIEDAVNIYQFPTGLFMNNRKIVSVSGMFAYGGPRLLDGLIFNYSTNSRIRDVSSFMYHPNRLSNSSTVPTFWLNWDITSYSRAYAGIDDAIAERLGIPENYRLE